LAEVCECLFFFVVANKWLTTQSESINQIIKNILIINSKSMNRPHSRPNSPILRSISIAFTSQVLLQLIDAKPIQLRPPLAWSEEVEEVGEVYYCYGVEEYVEPLGEVFVVFLITKCRYS